MHSIHLLDSCYCNALCDHFWKVLYKTVILYCSHVNVLQTWIHYLPKCPRTLFTYQCNITSTDAFRVRFCKTYWLLCGTTFCMLYPRNTRSFLWIRSLFSSLLSFLKKNEKLLPWKPTKYSECFGLPPMIPIQHSSFRMFCKWRQVFSIWVRIYEEEHKFCNRIQWEILLQ